MAAKAEDGETGLLFITTEKEMENIMHVIIISHHNHVLSPGAPGHLAA
jgi:hypothetical protein